MPGPLADVPAMIQALELKGIVYYEVSAIRREAEDGQPVVDDSAPDVPMNGNWGLRMRHEGQEFGVRIRVELETDLGGVIVDLAAEYAATEPFEAPEQDLAYDFANNVTLMQLFPYIRESVMSLTGKVFGNALLMPVFERGQIAFSADA